MFFAVPEERSGDTVITKQDDNSNTISPLVQVQKDTKLRRPIVYTTRLEDMSIFLQEFVHLTLKQINERIERESTPLFTNYSDQITDVELQSLLYKNMLDKFKNLNVDNSVDKWNRAEKFTATVSDTKKQSEKRSKRQISTRVKNTATLATSRKVNTKNYTLNLNRTNKKTNVEMECVTLISSDDEDLKNLDELRISDRNRSLLNLCKPVTVVLQDISKILKGKDLTKIRNWKRISGRFILDSKHSKTNTQLDHNRVIPIVPKPQSAILHNSKYNVVTLSQEQSIALPTSTKVDTVPSLPTRYRSPQSNALLLPPKGFTWNPCGVYVVFRDLCTKDTEAHFLDGKGHPKEYYKFDTLSMKEIETFITSQKFMEINCCCWHKREAYIQRMSPMFVPEQTAQLFRKPHKCPIYKCTCCCKGINSEFKEALGVKVNVTEPQVGSLHPGSKEDVTNDTKHNPDYIQELLSNCTNSNSLINKALRFERNKQLNKLRSFEVESGLNIINSSTNSTKINVKTTINGNNEIYIQDSIEKMTLHAIDVGNSIPELNVLRNVQVIENFCCWCKLQSLREKFNFPLTFSTAKHSCPPENCRCCCYKPEIKIEKPHLVDDHLPTRVRHSKLSCNEIERNDISKSVYSTGTTIETTTKKTPDEITDNSILSKILNTQKSTMSENNKLSCPLKNISCVKDYIDKVIVDSLNSPNDQRGKSPKEVNTGIFGCATPKAKVSTSITAELTDIPQTTCVSSTSTPFMSGVFRNMPIETNDPTCYPIITSVFSVAPQPADVLKAKTPVMTDVFSKSSETNASLTPNLRPGTSKGPLLTSTINPQEKIVESVISTVMETFKDVRLTINEDGKVAASLNTPIHKLNTTELKVLSKILAHAQSEVESLASRRGTNVKNSTIQLPLAAAMNAVNITSTNNTPTTASLPVQKASSLSTQSFPVLLIPVVPEPKTQTIYNTLSAEIGKKTEDYSRSYTSFKSLTTKHTYSRTPYPGATKRKTEHMEPFKPKIRVISPTKLGAPRNFMDESPVEDEETGQSSNEPETINEDFESQLCCFSIPNQAKKNTSLQVASTQMEIVLDNEYINEEIGVGDERPFVPGN